MKAKVFLFIFSVFLYVCSADWTEILLDGTKSIDDCKCDVAAVREANSQQLNSILLELLNTTFFRLFKVPKDDICPFDIPIEIDNIINIVEDDEELCEGENFDLGPLVQGGLFGEMSSNPLMKEPPSKCEIETEELDHTITFLEDFALTLATTEDEMSCDDETKPSFWLNMCVNIESDEKSDFINLQKNIEHYTGYNGTKVWNAIYKENCFNDKTETEMCLEERVLYRLTSGLHASINTHISLNFYEDKAKSNPDDEIRNFLPNPERFVRSIGSFPERVQNLYFSFVFLLRAVKKAEPLLKNTDYSVGNPAEEIHISQLVSHLLNSEVINSCRSVFEAFDERLLFQSEFEDVKLLKRNFKEIFFNISSYFNCVKCQRCKLHGKMQLLGIGTALKILLVPSENFDILKLSREEIVALINTLGKFSEAVEAIPSLVSLYWERQNANTSIQETNERPIEDLFNLKRSAVRAIGQLVKSQSVLERYKTEILRKILDEDQDVLVLAEYYLESGDFETFFQLLQERLGHVNRREQKGFDAIIVGSGLAGLTTALTILDSGGKVAILDKQAFLGGNSVKASSGINAVTDGEYNLFIEDIIKSGGPDNYNELELQKIEQLAYKSTEGLDFIQNRVGLSLPKIGQLGGHSEARTFRPASGLAGSEMIAKLLGQLNVYVNNGQLSIVKEAKVMSIDFSEDNTIAKGLYYQQLSNSSFVSYLSADTIVLATGGYAFTGEHNSILSDNRPELLNLRTTNGEHAVGDGLDILKESSEVEFCDLEHVQVHPTGFVPFTEAKKAIRDKRTAKNEKTSKLCAEVLRGVGGLLLDQSGKRFINELEKRDVISQAMLQYYKEGEQPFFYILLNSMAMEEVESHVKMYQKGGFLKEFTTLEAVADNLGFSAEVLKSELREYYVSSIHNNDTYGRVSFKNPDFTGDPGPFNVGVVTPVVHYSMGGVVTNLNGQVLTATGSLNNVFAVGELVGGIHGHNRLGGNALTECVVSGLVVGKYISETMEHAPVELPTASITQAPKPVSMKSFTLEELEKANSEQFCLVQLLDNIYDLTEFIPQHPAGKHPIVELCGKDGTENFEEVHSYELLQGYSLVPIGKLIKETGS